jgi:hypothetical protein
VLAFEEWIGVMEVEAAAAPRRVAVTLVHQDGADVEARAMARGRGRRGLGGVLGLGVAAG